MAVGRNCSFALVQILVVFFLLCRISTITGCRDVTETTVLPVTTAVGYSAKLPCNVNHIQFSSWSFVVQGMTPNILAQGNTVYTKWEHKYSLQLTSVRNESTNYTIHYDVYNLLINNVTEDVEGLYTCQEQGCRKAKINLSVEVPPVLWLEKEHSNISNVINVTKDKEINIRCKAVGGKPVVSLAWEINGEIVTTGVTNENLIDGVSSILHYRPKLEDESVACKSSGQVAVPSLKTSVNINVLYPPTCQILSHNASSSTYTVTCVCVAYPEVSSLVIIVNDFPYNEGKTVSLPVTLKTNIYCRAENGVGSYETSFFNHTPPVTPVTTTNPTQSEQKGPQSLIVIISVIIVIVIISAIAVGSLRYRRYTVTSTYFAWGRNEGCRTMSNRPPCPSPHVNHRIISAVDDNYSYVPSHDVVVSNGLSNEKPNVSLDSVVAEGDEYNLQYFQIPRCNTENTGNEYAVADSKESEDEQDGVDVEPGSSCASSFSDSPYFRSSCNWDDTTLPKGATPNKNDPYEWTEPNKEQPYEWSKPNKRKESN